MEFRKIIKYEIQDLLELKLITFRKQLLFLLLISVPIAYYFNSNEGYQFNWLRLITDFIFTVIIIAIVFYCSIVYDTRKSYNTIKSLQAPHETLIDEYGVHLSSEYSNSNYKWQDIYNAKGTKKAIYFFIFKKQAVIIPKRLITADDENILKSLLKEHLPADKIKL